MKAKKKEHTDGTVPESNAKLKYICYTRIDI